MQHSIAEGTVLWTPTLDRVESSRIHAYQQWLQERSGREFEDYPSLWSWSVDEVEDFWLSIIDFFDVPLGGSLEPVLGSHPMPAAKWFPNATINYAARALSSSNQGIALVYRNESTERIEITYDELRNQVAQVQSGLKRLGVTRGDRVVGYLPNCPEAVISFLASASLGAVWSSCPPEFGVDSVLDRFRQIEPKILIATDAYDYGGKTFDRSEHLATILDQLPTLERTVLLPRGQTLSSTSKMMSWHELSSEPDELRFEPVPFEHPLWILYSSGTTGIPKAIVHGHGGIVLEHLKQLALHADLGSHDRFFWYSTTGWMMWNYLVGGLLVGSTVVLYEGSPGYPDLDRLFRLAEEEQITYLGTSAPFILACLKAGRQPKETLDLSSLRAVGSTGAPLPIEGFQWIYSQVKVNLLLASISGGTDVCTAFVGSCPSAAGARRGDSMSGPRL